MRKLLLGAALAAMAIPGAAHAASPCATRSSHPTTYQHVVWVIMENHSYADIVGSSQAPYWNSLASQCGVPLRDYGVSHPSLPNYIGLTSGQLFGIHDDASPSSHQINAPSIFSQLGSNWLSLQESMPSNCYLGNSGRYAVKHNPAAYYTNIRSACAAQDVPLGSTPDISRKFTLVTPNLCNDMHDCSIGTGDAWLAGFLPKIFNSPTYLAGSTAVFVTFDEDEDGTWKVPTLVIAPYVRAGIRPNTIFNHYSLLRTTEEMLGLPCLAGACSVNSMRTAFGL